MIKTIVTDIEGTTSSLSFVKDVLFPYARERIGQFVHQHAHEPAVQQLLADAMREAGRQMSEAEVVTQLVRWIDEDKKITPLKALQGMIWEQGYHQGDFRGHVYADAVENLRLWKERGIQLYVYSSGSVHAQKLLFGFTEYGDLTPLFSGYFDTTIGGKRDHVSYRRIVDAIGCRADEILFLSDIREELDAAHDAGMLTGWLMRDGVASQGGHRQYTDFDQVTDSLPMYLAERG